MLRYFFHLHGNGEILYDTEGRELPDDLAIAAAALIEVRAIISAEALEGLVDLRQRLDIMDGDARIVHRLRFRDAVTLLDVDG